MSEPENAAMQRVLYECVAKSWMEVVGDRDGEPVFSLTEEGRRHVEEMAARPPEERA